MDSENVITNPPQGSVQADEPREYYFGFITKVMEDLPAVELVLPRNNLIGTLILTELVNCHFALAKVQPSTSAIIGDLNHCIGIFSTSELAPGLRALEAALNSISVLRPDFIQIFYHDPNEMLLRCVGNSRIAGLGDLTLEQLKELHSRLAEPLKARITALVASLLQIKKS